MNEDKIILKTCKGLKSNKTKQSGNLQPNRKISLTLVRKQNDISFQKVLNRKELNDSQKKMSKRSNYMNCEKN